MQVAPEDAAVASEPPADVTPLKAKLDYFNLTEIPPRPAKSPRGAASASQRTTTVAENVSTPSASGKTQSKAQAITPTSSLKFKIQATEKRLSKARNDKLSSDADLGKFERRIRVMQQAISAIQSIHTDKKLNHVVPDAVTSLATALVRQYPAENHAYLMVGNSPAPLLAVMQQQWSESTLHLPLGGFGGPVYSDADAADKLQIDCKVGVIIDKVLSPLQKVEKSVVLVDFAISGATLEYIFKQVETWRSTHSKANETKVFAYANSRPPVLKKDPQDPKRTLLSGTYAMPVGETEEVFMELVTGKHIKNLGLKAAESYTLVRIKGQPLGLAYTKHPANYKWLCNEIEQQKNNSVSQVRSPPILEVPEWKLTTVVNGEEPSD